MKLNFRGAWNGYADQIMAGLDAEEGQNIVVEDTQHSVCVTAGCRPNWISYVTAAKLAFAMLDILKAHSLTMQPYVFRLKPDRNTEKELLLDSAEALEVLGPTLLSKVGGAVARKLDVGRWTAEIVANPNNQILTNERLQGKAVLESMFRRLLWEITRYDLRDINGLRKHFGFYWGEMFPEAEPPKPQV